MKRCVTVMVRNSPPPRERHRQQDLDPPDVFPSPPPTHDNSWLHPPRSLSNTLGPHALLPKPREHLLRRSGRSCRRALARDGESGARCRLASRISREALFDPLLHPFSNLRESRLTAHITPCWPSSLGAPAPSRPLASSLLCVPALTFLCPSLISADLSVAFCAAISRLHAASS